MSSHQGYQTQAIYLRHWKMHNALHIAEELFVSNPWRSLDVSAGTSEFVSPGGLASRSAII